MPLNEGAKAALAGVQGGLLQQMAQLVNEDARVESVQPVLYLLEQLKRRLLRQIAFVSRKRNGDFQLFGQRQINREDGTHLFPLFLPRGIGSSGSRIKCSSSLVHGCIIQSHSPCVNLTATALRPS